MGFRPPQALNADSPSSARLGFASVMVQVSTRSSARSTRFEGARSRGRGSLAALLPLRKRPIYARGFEVGSCSVGLTLKGFRGGRVRDGRRCVLERRLECRGLVSVRHHRPDVANLAPTSVGSRSGRISLGRSSCPERTSQTAAKATTSLTPRNLAPLKGERVRDGRRAVPGRCVERKVSRPRCRGPSSTGFRALGFKVGRISRNVGRISRVGSDLAGRSAISLLHLAETTEAPARRKLLEVVRSRPPSTRSKHDVDQQFVEERASWRGRSRRPCWDDCRAQRKREARGDSSADRASPQTTRPHEPVRQLGSGGLRGTSGFRQASSRADRSGRDALLRFATGDGADARAVPSPSRSALQLHRVAEPPQNDQPSNRVPTPDVRVGPLSLGSRAIPVPLPRSATGHARTGSTPNSALCREETTGRDREASRFAPHDRFFCLREPVLLSCPTLEHPIGSISLLSECRRARSTASPPDSRTRAVRYGMEGVGSEEAECRPRTLGRGEWRQIGLQRRPTG